MAIADIGWIAEAALGACVRRQKCVAAWPFRYEFDVLGGHARGQIEVACRFHDRRDNRMVVFAGIKINPASLQIRERIDLALLRECRGDLQKPLAIQNTKC